MRQGRCHISRAARLKLLSARGPPPVQNRLIADRGLRLALLILVNLRQTFEEGSCFRLQSEKAHAPEDSRDPQMIVISPREPDCRLGSKIRSASDCDLLG